MPEDPIRSVWNRIRALGRKVEEEVYDFTEEDIEREEEPRGRNTVIALLNAFLTMWKASQANVGERTLGVAGFAGLLWLIVGDRGLGIRRYFESKQRPGEKLGIDERVEIDPQKRRVDEGTLDRLDTEQDIIPRDGRSVLKPNVLTNLKRIGQFVLRNLGARLGDIRLKLESSRVAG